MKRRSLACLYLVVVSLVLSGCDSAESKNIMDGVDKSAIEEYEAMIEAGNQAMSNEDDSKTP